MGGNTGLVVIRAIATSPSETLCCVTKMTLKGNSTTSSHVVGATTVINTPTLGGFPGESAHCVHPVLSDTARDTGS